MAVKSEFQKQNLQLSQLESRLPRSLANPSFSQAYLWNGETHVLVQGQLAPITEGETELCLVAEVIKSLFEGDHIWRLDDLYQNVQTAIDLAGYPFLVAVEQ
eukprot:11195556-Karenia_brevis.AAC.1